MHRINANLASAAYFKAQANRAKYPSWNNPLAQIYNNRESNWRCTASDGNSYSRDKLSYNKSWKIGWVINVKRSILSLWAKTRNFGVTNTANRWKMISKSKWRDQLCKISSKSGMRTDRRESKLMPIWEMECIGRSLEWRRNWLKWSKAKKIKATVF